MRALLSLVLFAPRCALAFVAWLALLAAALLECAGIGLRHLANAGADWLSGVTL